MTRRPAPGEAWSRWRVRMEEGGGSEPLCIALANTHPLREGATDQLARGDDLLAFACRQGLCDEAAGAALAAHAAAHPRAAHAELLATHALRSAILRLLLSPAGAIAEDQALLAREFESAQRAIAVELRGGALLLRPRGAGMGLGTLRLMAAASASALLASPQAARVRRCADARGCGRLFVDTTRNRSRRYCMSGECGNRARQAAFRVRRRGTRAR
jgi:predicted RNA-binding Zn ribbon-like protein